jgi:tRNA threonylcarbamoyl adenosine modification protein YeaZ
MAEGLVLAMDGSTAACTAALLTNGSAEGPVPTGSGADSHWRVVAERTEVDGRGQARTLLRAVDDMLREVGAGPDDLAAIVVGTGPGTFTGVRLAVATARALALALAVPVVGVSTLSSLAAGAARKFLEAGVSGSPDGHPDLVVPVVDARRGQLFFGLYRVETHVDAGPEADANTPRFGRTEPFAVCDRDALATIVGRATPSRSTAVIVGEAFSPEVGTSRGAVFFAAQVRAASLVIGQDLLDEPGGGIEGRRLAPWLADHLAGRMGGRALGVTTPQGVRGNETYTPGEPGSPEAVKPIYVRSPDADIHIAKMRDPWADPAADR